MSLEARRGQFAGCRYPARHSEAGAIGLAGVVGISGDGIGGLLPETRVPKVVEVKVRKYGKSARAAALPLVVAVGDPEWLRPSHHNLTMLEQMFAGKFTETLDWHDGTFVSTGLSRNNDGLWARSGMHRLDGVIIINTQRWQWADLSVTAFAVNPDRAQDTSLAAMLAAWPAPITSPRAPSPPDEDKMGPWRTSCTSGLQKWGVVEMEWYGRTTSGTT